ncbi:MAG: hypothetical protein PHV34_12635 [Verrucomicrobiae bacterium]|nr:hypothetical protein [Verrucomicrobiae bacterium]
MKRSWLIILLAVTVVFLPVKIYDWWNHRGLITMDAVNEEILPVLKEVSRQSGCAILSPTNTTGKVTVHFRLTPLAEALNVLRDQTEGRWQKCFFIGRNQTAFSALGKKLIETGPPFLITQGFGPGPDETPPSISTNSTPAQTKAAAFSVSGRDLQSASLMLALQIKTPVMVEENFNPTISLATKHGAAPGMVQKLARSAGAKSRTVYLFQVFGRREFRRGPGNSEAGPPGGGPTPFSHDAMNKQREEQLALLPPEERQRHEEWRKQMAEIAKLSPEERRARFEQMMTNAPNREARAEQRNRERIRNLTPEQRVKRNQRYLERARQRGVEP